MRNEASKIIPTKPPFSHKNSGQRDESPSHVPIKPFPNNIFNERKNSKSPLKDNETPNLDDKKRLLELENALKLNVELQNSVNNLELENYRLREMLENLKCRMEAVSHEENKISEIVKEISEKPIPDPNISKIIIEKMVTHVRELKRSHESMKEDLEEKAAADNEFLLKQLEDIPKTEIAKSSSEILNGIYTMAHDHDELKASIARMPQFIARAPNHFKTIETKLANRKELRKKRTDNIILELKETALKKKISVQPLPRKMLLKLISYFYSELSQSMCADALTRYVYDELSNKYGLRNVADRKFLQVVVGCVAYRNIKRIQLFGRFLGVFDALGYDQFKTYIDTLNLLRKLYFSFFIYYYIKKMCGNWRGNTRIRRKIFHNLSNCARMRKNIL